MPAKTKPSDLHKALVEQVETSIAWNALVFLIRKKTDQD